MAIPSPLWHTKTFLFGRGRGRDFTERDRHLLDLLQPHLARIWLAGKTRRLLSSALAQLDRVDEHDPRGVILLGLGGEIDSPRPRPNACSSRSSRPEAANNSRLPWLSGSSRETRSR